MMNCNNQCQHRIEVLKEENSLLKTKLGLLNEIGKTQSNPVADESIVEILKKFKINAPACVTMNGEIQYGHIREVTMTKSGVMEVGLKMLNGYSLISFNIYEVTVL